jgi:hypothetical protein
VPATQKLYLDLDSKIDPMVGQADSDRPVFLMNVTSVEEARALEELPLGQAGLTELHSRA